MTNDTRSADIAFARKIDTELAELWAPFYAANKIAAAAMTARDKVAHRLDAAVANPSSRPATIADLRETLAKHVATVREQGAIASAASAAATAFDREHYTGWSRFFLVQHIHSSQHCSSFRPTTSIGWLPDVSGLTEAEAVAEHGATLCTICFPSAPVELTVAKLDPAYCSGSGKYHSTEHLTGRENMYYSPAGYCPDCLRWNGITKAGNMRKHKVDETRRSAV